MAANAGLLRDLGADDVIDYRAIRFEDAVHDVDVVLDSGGGDTLERSWGVLRRGGALVTIAGSAPADKAAPYGVRGMDSIVKPSRAQLIEIARLIDAPALSGGLRGALMTALGSLVAEDELTGA